MNGSQNMKQGKERAEYGSHLIKRLAKGIEPEYGSGFGVRQLKFCRLFYKTCPKGDALRSQLNWSQYRMHTQIPDTDKRECYELEVANFLHLKWIEPVCSEIDNSLLSILADLESSVLALSKKYAVSYEQINSEMAAANGELAGLVNQLTGDEFAIKGLKELIKG